MSNLGSSCFDFCDKIWLRMCSAVNAIHRLTAESLSVSYWRLNVTIGKGCCHGNRWRRSMTIILLILYKPVFYFQNNMISCSQRGWSLLIQENDERKSEFFYDVIILNMYTQTQQRVCVCVCVSVLSTHIIIISFTLIQNFCLFVLYQQKCFVCIRNILVC